MLFNHFKIYFAESITHNYVSTERHNPPPLPTIPIPIEYDHITTNQYHDKNYKSHGSHAMSGPYEGLSYDVINKQTNESLKQQCEKAMHELNQLRRQHSETSRRCDHVMKVNYIHMYTHVYSLEYRYVQEAISLILLRHRYLRQFRL